MLPTNYLHHELMTIQGPISGTFRIREPYFGESQTGRPFIRLRLEDSTGHCYAYSWQTDVMHCSGMHDMSRVYIEGHIRHQSAEPIIELATMLPAKISYQDLIRLIPQSLAPQPELLTELEAALRIFTIPVLKDFIWRVLVDDSIALPFISCPGSLNHHHNWPGGLLKHSLEAFSTIEHQRGFKRTSYELGLAAALFHDIGKTLTLTPHMTLTSLGACVEHEKLTCEVIGPALKHLQRNWFEGAKELRYLLGWKVKTAIPHYNMADLVACSDRISAGLNMETRRG